MIKSKSFVFESSLLFKSCFNFVSSAINETSQWKALELHTNIINSTHLKTLLQDETRCAALSAEHEGIVLDYSRERILPSTMV